MSYSKFLERTANENKSLVCFGLDPVIERIPIERDSIESTIVMFYSEILDAMISEDSLPSACKPNYAFFAQYGFDGLRALKKVIDLYASQTIPVIFDGKRGDIGKSSIAYAKEVFDFWRADAITIAPYMGFDSVQPFIERAEKNGKGVYILARTSNKGAEDFQSLKSNKKELYKIVSEKIIDWSKKAEDNVGAVVGATSLKELEELSKLFSSAKHKIPLLIPGVGAQGGSAKEVTNILKKTKMSIDLQRINSSSALNYAFEKAKTDDFAGASVKALQKLNKEIGFP